MGNRPARNLRKVLLTLSVFFVLACVSRSLPLERFTQSLSLAAPDLNITLSDSENYSFAIVGDLHIRWGGSERWEKILESAAAEGDSFIIALGDIVDKGEEPDFAFFKSSIVEKGWDKKVLPVIGNHDVFGDGWLYYQSNLGPSHYSVDIGNARFIAFDTADGTITEKEREWLDTQLVGTRPKHLFFLSHYLPVVPGVRTYLRIANDDEALALMNIASRNNVTAWLGAHYHSFVTGKVGGVDYVVAGGGGGVRMPPVMEYFYVKVTVRGDEVTYEKKTIS